MNGLALNGAALNGRANRTQSSGATSAVNFYGYRSHGWLLAAATWPLLRALRALTPLSHA